MEESYNMFQYGNEPGCLPDSPFIDEFMMASYMAGSFCLHVMDFPQPCHSEGRESFIPRRLRWFY
jgi:hypothetical protein